MDVAGSFADPHRPDGLPVRLALLPARTEPLWCDGTWWPRSHDLGRELPTLITALEERWPGITRVTVSRAMWRIRPESLALDENRSVRIDRCDVTPDPHTIRLRSDESRCDLLVTPPGAEWAGRNTRPWQAR
ncbi:DUF5994 family protein [Streptomyces bathyalis]|uniref:DUF5994 family protein n=1 Tax=Streptomyces bathyalis TaxID=2710756 RepID=UPI001FE6F2C6|nr:DUF5994 family protein [Streptomyces bathyalis]